MPELPDSLAPKQEDSKDSAELIQWHTISYRAVYSWIIGLVVLALVILTIVSPHWWLALASVFSASEKPRGTAPAALARQVRFTNLEGEVRVKKANEVQWITASVSMSLGEGDTVQTLKDGMARISFPDDTLYVVKPDTLIVIEESAVPTDKQAANVAVQVTSGVVDLSTARGGADSRVKFSNAEARIHQDSRALVASDPETNTHQITVSKGGARLARGGEEVELAQYEQASFGAPGTQLLKNKVAMPPVLLTPANMAPVPVSTSPAEVEFTWSAVPGVTSYRLRVSASPIFSTVLYDRRLQSTSVRLPSFKEGNFYWSVASISPAQKESQPSETNQFTIVQQGAGGELLLVVDKYVQHGRQIEIVGRTEPGATLLINNEPVFNVASDGSFKHFTAPLPNLGSNQISITAQNSKGKVATLRKTITIQ
jgi:hypothetical protein